MSNGKVALIILDGYGIGEPNDGNAIYMAQTPVMDGLLQRWPHTKLSASGLDVGLPDGQMGNSEVGHTNIGSGRVVFQDLPRITKAIEDGTFFENPIAGPFVLGISSGAKMVVALAMIYFIGRYQVVSSYTLIIAAFIGSLIATGFILLVSRRVQHMATLLVAGIMIGYICSAVTDFVVTFAEDSDIVNLHGWSQGSFSGMSWSNVQVAAIVVGIAALLAFLMSKPIGAYQLGEAYAQSMGVNIKAFRVILILLSSILSACVTAFAGPISFVGIAVPYLVKRGLHTSRPLVVIPGTFLGGAVFCMFCDLIARMAFAPTELNISTVTSVFGAPIVIFMMLRRKRGN